MAGVASDIDRSGRGEPGGTRLPSWITLPATILIAGSFGVRWAGMFQRDASVVFATLAVDIAWLLPLWGVAMLPFQRFRRLRVARAPWPRLMAVLATHMTVATMTGLVAFAWVYWGPLATPLGAGLAYAVVIPAAVASGASLRRRAAE